MPEAERAAREELRALREENARMREALLAADDVQTCGCQAAECDPCAVCRKSIRKIKAAISPRATEGGDDAR